MGLREKLKGRLQDRQFHQILVVLFAFIAITCILSLKLGPELATVSVGQVASRDIEAPHNLEVKNDKATAQARQQVGEQVTTVYTPRNVWPEVDESITRTFQ